MPQNEKAKKATPNIPIPRRIDNKIQEQFYPLQKEELIKLSQIKLINNAAFVHLALKYENPFCTPLRDRLHLFGAAKELEKLADIESACLAFDVRVTGEES